MLIADLARLCGLRAAVAEGWKADLTRWTIEELSDITQDMPGIIFMQTDSGECMTVSGATIT